LSPWLTNAATLTAANLFSFGFNAKDGSYWINAAKNQVWFAQQLSSTVAGNYTMNGYYRISSWSSGTTTDTCSVTFSLDGVNLLQQTFKYNSQSTSTTWSQYQSTNVKYTPGQTGMLNFTSSCTTNAVMGWDWDLITFTKQ